jgi:hypothetical protein
MSRLTIFLIILLLIAAGALLLSLPYLSPSTSIAECWKISTSDSAHDDCFESVAIIRGEEYLCQYMSYSQQYCKDDVRAYRNTKKWELRKSTTKDDYYYRYSDYTNKTLRCAVDGLISRNTYYTKDYLDLDIGSYDVEFADNCKSLLASANESICDNLSYYDSNSCDDNIKLAKGTSQKSYYCDSDYAIYKGDVSACCTDDCYQTLAIKNNNPSYCSNISYDSHDCWFYFALKNSDTTYCDYITKSSTYYPEYRYYCRAVVLAEKGQ